MVFRVVVKVRLGVVVTKVASYLEIPNTLVAGFIHLTIIVAEVREVLKVLQSVPAANVGSEGLTAVYVKVP